MYRAPRGTLDILPEEQPYWRYVEHRAISLFHRYGYQRIDTPILEDYSLFVRGVGEVTDVVEKEMYTITDKGDDVLTLRPEGTAGVCRAYLQHGLHNQPQPVRLYSVLAAMFRYSRPQAGRLRQFHQLNVEAIGDGDSTVDAEVVGLSWNLFQEMELAGLNILLNSIGDSRCRPAYLKELKHYYSLHIEQICKECKARLERNPLRLLDCKVEGCQPVIADAPHSSDYLCDDCARHFNDLKRYLTLIDVPYSLDHRLVRGLDYYTRTVFEIQTGEEGGQNALGGGGRYDGLVEELGGKPTPGVGFAVGVERVILSLKRQGISPVPGKNVQVFVAHVGREAKAKAVQITATLAKEGISALLAPASKSLKAQLRQAGSMDIPRVIILADQELQRGMAILRDMTKGEQKEVSLAQITDALAKSLR